MHDHLQQGQSRDLYVFEEVGTVNEYERYSGSETKVITVWYVLLFLPRLGGQDILLLFLVVAIDLVDAGYGLYIVDERPRLLSHGGLRLPRRRRRHICNDRARGLTTATDVCEAKSKLSPDCGERTGRLGR